MVGYTEGGTWAENRVLRRTYGPKWDEVTGEWRKLHNEELNNLVLLTRYFSGDQIEKNKISGTCSKSGGEERRMQGFGGETVGKETTGESQT
jgi:hypothetical protein